VSVRGVDRISVLCGLLAHRRFLVCLLFQKAAAHSPSLCRSVRRPVRLLEVPMPLGKQAGARHPVDAWMERGAVRLVAARALTYSQKESPAAGSKMRDQREEEDGPAQGCRQFICQPRYNEQRLGPETRSSAKLSSRSRGRWADSLKLLLALLPGHGTYLVLPIWRYALAAAAS